MRRIVRRAIPLVVAAVMLLASVVLSPPQASGAGRYRAGLVVQHEDGTTHMDCVRFAERSISGFALLARSRFRFLTAKFDFGRAVCRLDGEGCRTTRPKRCNDCAPQDNKFDGKFWGYHNQHRGQAVPRFADEGMTQRRVTTGDIDYWVFGDGSVPPVPKRLRQICRG